jgi:hypothetical protein
MLTLSCYAAPVRKGRPRRLIGSSRRCTRPTTLRSPAVADQSNETCWAGGYRQSRPPGRREVTDGQSAEERPADGHAREDPRRAVLDRFLGAALARVAFPRSLAPVRRGSAFDHGMRAV